MPPTPFQEKRPKSFLKTFGRLAIANMFSNLMVPLAGIIDTAFLGHLAEVHYLGGVAISAIIFNVVYWSFSFLRMGTTGTIAQAYGRQDFRTISLILLRNGLLAVAIGCLILLLQVPIRQLGFWLLSADTDVRLSGEAFYNARIWGAPAVLLNYVLLGLFIGCGQGKRVIAMSIVGNGSNILLDYLFIWRLGWASAGAGAATAMSQGCMLLVGSILVLRKFSLPQLWRLRTDLWEGSAVYAMVRLNRDLLIRTFALLISFALFTNWSSAMGTAVLAANTLLLQVVTLTSYFVDGLAFATESFAGQFYGVGDRTRLQTLLIWGISLGTLVGVTIALVFLTFPKSLFQVMTQHDSVISQVEDYVGWLVPILGFGAIAFLLDGYFLGLTAGSSLRNSTLVATLAGFLPIGLIAQSLEAPHLLWLALTSFMALRAITLLSQIPKTLQPVHKT
ncbi:MATE family efflux transporter [Oscillatoria sp. CS-180]|uniref:MATE family efflux transporter n=1 Tax=Oscillatoria sp. CS-180 TaxID=3021720 RepID=UPI00232EB68D|nr:MATE family efflux transporter [Oscillatoria sp. CS-180]MDB9525505.1 MATE family efflux transporter [Oscillatoria sp. CS-180]